MILYNYHCKNCNSSAELFAEMADLDLKECVKCATISLYRTPSSNNLIVGCPTPKFHAKD